MVLAGGVLVLGLSRPAAADSPAIYLEDSPAAQEEVERGLVLREQGRIGDAADRLQQVILEHPYKLMRTGAGLYEDMLTWLRRRIGSDPELLEAYRQRFAAQAQRLREQAMEPRPDPAGLERVLAGFAVTEPGLEAGMDLAALYLERADGRSGASVLDELADHPDLEQPEHRQRYHQLQAVAGLLAGEPARADAHRAALEEAGFDEPLAMVDDFAGRLAPPTDALAWGRAAPTVDAGVSAEQLETALWEGEVQWTPLGPTATEAMHRTRRGREQSVVPVRPVADDRRLYLNQGDRVRALDRDSGWEVWAYRWRGAGAPEGGRGLSPMRQVRLYERGVGLAGDRVYAVLGAASPWPSRWDQGSAITALVSIDRQHGEPVWQIEPGALDPAFSEAYFIGTPVATGDRVFVLVRRSQASGFKDTFVAAISPRDGSLLWRRHIASAAVASRFRAGPRPRMRVDGGEIFVADNFGAVAALDQRSGAMRWVRLLVDPEAAQEAEAEQAAGRHASQASSEPGGSAPLPVGAGLLVLDPNDGPPLLLERRTGEVLDELDEAPWAEAEALMGVGEDVLVIGPALVLADGATLEPRWEHEPDGGAPASPEGQVAATQDHVFYLGEDALVMLSREDGELAHRHATETPANVLPLSHQLVVVGEERVHSYMDWHRAAERLRDRIAESPTEPEPGMALAHLALRRGYGQRAIEGVDASLKALRHLRYGREGETPGARAAQRHAFDHLLDLARSDAAREAGISEPLFDRLATITDGPKQETGYHLAVAAFLADAERPDEAVEHLQAVLGDRTLAGELHEDGTVSRQAGLEARRRLQELVEAHGQSIYEPHDRRARAEFHRLRRAAAEPTELIALAERYPLASAAPEALIIAAERLARRDDLPGAAQQLRRARDWAATPEGRAEVVGRAAWLYERHNQPRQAIGWLDRLRRQHPEARPERDGTPLDVETWIDRLRAQTPDIGPLPKLELPLNQPLLLTGRLIPVPATADDLAPRTILLTEHRDMLRRYEDESLELRWEAPFPVDDAELIAADEDRLLFWSPGAERVFALDDATGDPAWSTDPAAEMLAEVADPDQREEGRHADHQRFMRMVEHAPHLRQRREQERWRGDDREVFTAVGSSTVAVADRQGRVVGIDRRSGRVLWRLLAATEMVTQIAVDEDRLALAGINGAGSDAESGALSVLDLLSGEPHLPLIEDQHQPRWVGLAGNQHLVVVNEQQITAYRQATGEVAWRSDLEHAQPIVNGWADHRMLVLSDEERVARLYDVASGEYLGRADLSRRQGDLPVRGDLVEDRWYILAAEGLRAFDATGEIQWRDAIGEMEHTLETYLATQSHIVVIARGEDPARAAGQRMRVFVQGPDGGAVRARREQADEGGGLEAHLYLIDRKTGVLEAEHPVGPLPGRLEPRHATLQHNRLILPLREHTLVIPGAGER